MGVVRMSEPGPGQSRRWVAGSAAVFCAAAILLPLVGPSPLDFERVWARADPDWTILVQLRVTRTLLGLFGGAALALAGSLFQAMLRDGLLPGGSPAALAGLPMVPRKSGAMGGSR